MDGSSEIFSDHCIASDSDFDSDTEVYLRTSAGS